MADKKISALTAASTPLAGSEVLPIVQSGSTVKVSIDNLTTGKTVPMNQLNLENSTVGFPTLGTASGSFRMLGSGGGGFGLFGGLDGGTGRAWLQSMRTDGAVAYDLRLQPVGGNVRVGVGDVIIETAGKGIDFSANANAPGMTSELLTWYEEGTFNATISDGTTTAVMDNALKTCAYTRIGRQVTVTGYIGTTSMAGVTGSLQINNLPFTVANSNAFYGGGAVTFATNLSITAGNSVVVLPIINTTRCGLYLWGGATGTPPMAGADWTNTGQIVFSLTYFTA